jgi:hypothetical protein
MLSPRRLWAKRTIQRMQMFEWRLLHVNGLRDHTVYVP